MNTDTVINLIDNSSQSTRGFDTKVYDQIVRFLRSHRRDSKNTSEAYERDIRHFFRTTRKKDIEHLNKKDLEFTIEQMEDYQDHLLDKEGLSTSTVNRYITSISEMMRHLSNRGLLNDTSFLSIKRPKSIANSYDGLTMQEVEQAMKLVAQTGREKTARIKRAIILFSADTCARREECMELKWNDFEVREEGKITVRTVAKGNKVMRREISNNLYNELLKIREPDKEKVFNIGSATIDRMMVDIREGLNIDEDRRYIVFHSIRKAGAQWIWEKTRDINQVSQALGHASIQTTELYINKNENYGVMGAFSSADAVDDELYKEVAHEDLLKAIDNLGMDKKLFINLELDKLK